MGKYRVILALAGFCCIALCLRIIAPYDQVFSSEWIKFTSVDAYYHMRLVDNLAHNFPQLINTDPYLQYPGAVSITGIHFFDWLLAGIIWAVSLGNPTQSVIDTVGIYYPAILGAMVVIPVYFIGKAVFNKWVGFISAGLIAVIPGEFLGRSILGFTDHDIMGVLLSTAVVLFTILAIKTAGGRRLELKSIIYSILAGLFLGLYFVTWAGALLLVFVLFIFFTIQFIINYLKHYPTSYLCIISTIIFVIGFAISLFAYQDKIHLASFGIAIVTPLALGGLIWLVTKMRAKPIHYPLIVFASGVVGMYLFNITGIFDYISQRFALPFSMTQTTLEMQPLFFPSGEFTLGLVWGNFTTALPISLIALCILAYLVIKQGNAEKNLLVVWSLVILAVALEQRRFACYLAVNVALLTGYLSWLVLNRIGFKKYTRVALTGVIIFVLVFIPNITKAVDTAKQVSFAPSDDWCESLTWLKDNTADPFGDANYYYELYDENVTMSDYAVLSWWDYGYWITRIAHRVPNTNPAQGGILPVACFLLSQDEGSASGIIQALNSGYVIIDRDMVMGKLWAIALWSGSDLSEFSEVYYSGKMMPIRLFYPEYYKAFAARLYNFDGEHIEASNINVIIYEEMVGQNGKVYRLITKAMVFPNYEEAIEYVNDSGLENCRIVGLDPLKSPVEIEAVENYELVYKTSTVKVFKYLGN